VLFQGFMEEREMKTRIPKRTYTTQFREAAVRQVIEVGRTATDVSCSLDISPKTLGNWVRWAARWTPPRGGCTWRW
jgi:transposase-like protein